MVIRSYRCISVVVVVVVVVVGLYLYHQHFLICFLMPYETFSFVFSLFLLHLFFTLVIEGIYLLCFIFTGLRAYK
jgi:hypothetical protein